MTHKANSDPVTVEGQVVIASTVPPLRGAILHLYVEETSAIDAPAVRVAEGQVSPFNHPDRGAARSPTILRFSITLPLTRKQLLAHSSSRFTVRAWVDANRDGRTGANDLFSDQAYPVLTQGFENWVEMTLA